MVVCVNEDVPLVLGRIATTIGEAGVNIANLALGRKAQGGQAVTALNIDGPINPAVLHRLRALPHVIEARMVEV
jgi:D-3-phosphoglycerate dehydrogenase